MTVQKLSISVPTEVEELLREAAADGVGLADGSRCRKARLAALQAQGRAAAREMAAEYESEHGPLPEESKRRAHDFLLEVGLLDDESWPEVE